MKHRYSNRAGGVLLLQPRAGRSAKIVDTGPVRAAFRVSQLFLVGSDAMAAYGLQVGHQFCGSDPEELCFCRQPQICLNTGSYNLSRCAVIEGSRSSGSNDLTSLADFQSRQPDAIITPLKDPGHELSAVRAPQHGNCAEAAGALNTAGEATSQQSQEVQGIEGREPCTLVAIAGHDASIVEILHLEVSSTCRPSYPIHHKADLFVQIDLSVFSNAPYILNAHGTYAGSELASMSCAARRPNEVRYVHVARFRGPRKPTFRSAGGL